LSWSHFVLILPIENQPRRREKIRPLRAEFLPKRRVSCAKCLHISRQMRSVFSSICHLEKLAHFGLVEIENAARN
jgi:hypothetical protein